MAYHADLETLISNQRQELMNASASHADLDLAFDLQMEEAMTASVAFHPSASSSSSSTRLPTFPPPPSSIDDDIQDLISLQTLELDRFLQESQDNHLSQSEMSRISADLRRKIHDEHFARAIDSMPEEDWVEYGDNYEKPMEEVVEEEERPFRVYFKGMSSPEVVRGELVSLVAVGAAVCDPDDRLILKIQKPLFGAGNCPRGVIEGKALVEALAAAGTIGARNVDVFFDYRAFYYYVIGKWTPKQQKVANLIDQIRLQERKLDKCRMFLVPRCNIKYAFKLARDAIDSQMIRNVELSGNKDHKETCKICLEDTDSPNMFAVDICLHRFCFSCLKQHVEVKLLHGMLPSCPQDGCKNKLNVQSCRKFLSPKLLDIMVLRIKEASIPVTEKLYCPYPKCSALMSMNEALCPHQESSSNRPPFGTSGLRNCTKCNRSFCINCKVPWHDKLSCYDYKRLNPQKAEDLKLKVLAKQNLWRQCVKCNHMIELAEGCFHMTCRCGYEFCYTCGAEWKNKKATCSCPLWDENNILNDDSEDEDPDDYYDDDEDEEEEEEEDNYYHLF